MSDHYCCKRCGLRYDDCNCPPRQYPTEDTRKSTAAEKTLRNLGYTYEGGELWKPPLGKRPHFPEEND